MSTLFKGKHLRVRTPLTTNGVNLDYDSNNQVQYKTTFLPITALKNITSNNAKKPVHLRAIIEEVEGDFVNNNKPVINEMVKQAISVEKKPKNKGGRPKKVVVV